MLDLLRGPTQRDQSGELRNAWGYRADARAAALKEASLHQAEKRETCPGSTEGPGQPPLFAQDPVGHHPPSPQAFCLCLLLCFLASLCSTPKSPVSAVDLIRTLQLLQQGVGAPGTWA